MAETLKDELLLFKCANFRPYFDCFRKRIFNCCSVLQSDHLSGKPGNVREIDSCQRNVSLDFTENQGKNLVREKLPKTVYCKLHICVHTGI